MNTELKPGDTCWLPNGQQCEFVTTIEGGNVVKPMMRVDDEDDEPFFDDAIVAPKVFAAEPIALYSEKMDALQKRLDAKQSELTKVQGEIFEATQERSKLFDKIKEIPALKHLEDFIEGRLTHVLQVKDDQMAILTYKEAVGGYQKLITLEGSFSGYRWQLRESSDKWGEKGYEIHPFTSKEAAIAKAHELLDAKLAEIRNPSNWKCLTPSLIHTCQRFSYPVPTDLLEAMRNGERREIQRHLETYRGYVAGYEKQLAALDEPTEAAA